MKKLSILCLISLLIVPVGISQDIMGLQDSLPMDTALLEGDTALLMPIDSYKDQEVYITEYQLAEYFEYTDKSEHDSWIFIILIFQGIIIGSLRFFYYKDFRNLFTSITNIYLANQIFREQESTLTISGILFNINMFISGGVLSYFFFNYSGINVELVGFELIMVSILTLIGFYIVRNLTIWLISNLFVFGQKILLVKFHTNVLYRAYALLIYPLLFVAAFSPEIFAGLVLIIALGGLFLMLILKYLRGLLIIKDYLKLFGLYIIFYICTLEIVPVLGLVKIFKDYFV